MSAVRVLIKNYLNNTERFFMLLKKKLFWIALSLVSFNFLVAENKTSIKGIEVKSTINSIGINIKIKGDLNNNATCKVQYKLQYLKKWEEAQDLFRIKNNWKISSMNNKGRMVNGLAGSIFQLAPGSPYEVKLTLVDPEGGNLEKTFKIKTKLPKSPQSKPILVKPGSLKSAIEKAKPGDVLLLQKGIHGDQFTISVSGEPDKYIFITGEGIHEAKVTGGFKVSGNYIWIDNIHIQQPKVTFPTRGKKGITGAMKSHDLIVTRCKIENVFYGVHTYGHTCFATDNKIVGDKPTWTTDDQIYKHPIPSRRKGQLGGEGVDFGHDKGGQFIAAFNDISMVADGVSYGDNNVDVYNNEIYLITDDQIEPDYAYDNYRVWNNRGRTGLTGLSFQPFNGGPWYFFRNQISGNGSYVFKIKDNDGRGPMIFLNNTFIQTRPYYRNHVLMLSGGKWCNNIWGNLMGNHLGATYDSFTKDKTKLLDNNAYHTGGKHLFNTKKRQPITLKDIQNNGLEKNTLKVNLYDELNNLPANVKARDPGTSEPLNIKNKSKLIDKGIFLKNVSNPFTGTAPDIGVYEHGMGIGWYGPRNYTNDGFAYGVPTNWIIKKAENTLTLVNHKTKATIKVSFKKSKPEQYTKMRNTYFNTTKSKNIKKFLDSIHSSHDEKGLFLGTQLTHDGVWLIECKGEKKFTTSTQNDFFTFMASITQTCLIRIKQ